MTNDIKAGFLIFGLTGVLLLCVFALFRVIVPAILEAQFYGSVFAASAVGFAGIFVIGALALIGAKRIVSLLTTKD